jgi:hypothetical protein
MALEPVDVMARWESDKFLPRHFVWRGHLFPVESIGRQWEDDEGLHILCMIRGGAIFELVFRLQPAGWWTQPPVSGNVAA